MKLISKFLFCSILGIGCLSAEPPKNPEFNDYAMLLGDRSPFGKKIPPVVEKPEVVETKTTLSLAGLSKLSESEGWMVTLKDTAKPSERIILLDGEPNSSGVSLVEVNQDIVDHTKTNVVVRQGGRNFKVSFNMPEIEKNIAQAIKIKQSSKPATPKSNSGNNNRPSSNGSSAEYQKKRNEMMKEAEALRKMKEAGNEGPEYQKRRKALMDKANDMRSEWRQRRRGGSDRGR